MSRTTFGMAGTPSDEDYQSINSCGDCPACEQIGVLIIQINASLHNHIQQNRTLGTAYFTNAGAVKASWFDEDSNSTIADAFHDLPLLSAMSAEPHRDYLTSVCSLNSSWKQYSGAYDLIEGAVDGCLSTKLVWEPTFDDFSRESDGLVEMVKECDEHLAALELAVSHITDVANRPDPRLAAPIDPDIYQYYASWKALVESLEN